MGDLVKIRRRGLRPEKELLSAEEQEKPKDRLTLPETLDLNGHWPIRISLNSWPGLRTHELTWSADYDGGMGQREGKGVAP